LYDISDHLNTGIQGIMIAPSASRAEGPVFRDRRHAGAVLADALRAHRDGIGEVVLGLARGGVPVAMEVATRLGLELDVLVVRKVGVPWHQELAMGAVAGGGVRYLNRDVVREVGIAAEDVTAAIEREFEEAERRERSYRDGRPPVAVEGRPAIVVDDGMATGASMRVAVAALRQRGATRCTVAVPVAARAACAELRGEVDEIICAATPKPFLGVGLWYEDFSETTDDEVRRLLAEASAAQ